MRGIAGNYLVGKRCVNTGHTASPRPSRAPLSSSAFSLSRISVSFAEKPSPQDTVCPFPVCTLRMLHEFHRPRIYLVCLLHYNSPRYNGRGEEKTVVVRLVAGARLDDRVYLCSADSRRFLRALRAAAV